LKTSRLIATFVLAVAVFLLPFAGNAASDDSKINVNVDCHCPDPVGQKFCGGFKDAVQASPGYSLSDNTKGYGMGVHFSCVDLWQGINQQLAGHMSLVSVAFTIYSDALPGEVYEDSSVFRVGEDAIPEMSRKILAALGQLVSVNGSFFDRMRAAAKASPKAQTTPSAAP
jgi:hypothetical protein